MSHSIDKKIRTGTEQERFDASYLITPESGCWLWTRSIDKDGYGIFWFKGNKTFAHRKSYQLHKGEIGLGLLVCHRCDVTCCVNPAHLFLGTCKDNLQDAVSKKRFAVGTKNVKAKLTLNDVKNIRDSDRGTLALAKAYGVDRHTISNVRSGRTWGAFV
jgi:hypothetical protein